MFVLVTPDILEMEATAQVLDAFLLKPFPSEKKKKNIIIFARLVLPAYLVLTLSLLRSH